MKRNTVLRLLTASSLITLSIGVAFSQTVYIPEGSSNSVSVVDVKSGSVVGRFTNVEAAHGLSVVKHKKLLLPVVFRKLAMKLLMKANPIQLRKRIMQRIIHPQRNRQALRSGQAKAY